MNLDKIIDTVLDQHESIGDFKPVLKLKWLRLSLEQSYANTETLDLIVSLHLVGVDKPITNKAEPDLASKEARPKLSLTEPI